MSPTCDLHHKHTSVLKEVYGLRPFTLPDLVSLKDGIRPVYCQTLLCADDTLLIADSEEKLQGAVIEWTEILRGKEWQ
jgi:hypothetical protein